MKLIHEDYSAESLRLATIWVFSIWLAKILSDSIPLISLLPYAVYEPVGMIRAIPGPLREILLGSGVLAALKALVIASLLATVATMALDIRALRRTRGRPGGESLNRGLLWLAPPVAASLLLTLYEGLFRGYAGHISHEDTVLLYATYLLSAFPVADYIARRSNKFDASANLNQIAIVAVLLTLCATYTVVGTYRILHGGIGIFGTNSLTYWALRNTIDVLRPWVGWGFVLIDYPIAEQIFKLGFPIITIFEFLAPLSLVFLRFRILFLATFISFHIATLLFMDVVFRETLALYLLFLDPVKITDWIRARVRGA